eukprot:CAMPEP_0177652872 /NCGR_PEP_ID=MMETSP0447-20121125/13395_1 /TAXON_ID=0 /ORGANISM="Stygamoeba regulata, Strain BSH-02190019" /LENGTH=361 /DNA_ID=CAMNT_0019156213 /DNA_START=66 /DNA_END=1152 /DNA_ORIENTATION=+
MTDFPELKNDCFLRTALGKPCDRTPVWAMRQAGRYLPEFRAEREKADFFTICRTPELACEVTLQAAARFDLDAAIIFCDIMVIPQALGLEVLMLKGKGPSLPEPLLDPTHLTRLVEKVDIRAELGYVLDAVTLTRQRLEGKVPLIGFSGAPWTLMAYMVEGGGSKTWSLAKTWLYKHPKESHQLLQRITDVVVDYLVAKVEAGAQALQVFDSWAGELAPHIFFTFAFPYLQQIGRRIRERVGHEVPLIVFAKGASYAIPQLAQDTEYNVIGLDWTIEPAEAVKLATTPLEGKPLRRVTLQGNLDPCALFAERDTLAEEVVRMLNGFGSASLIANLGHGMQPNHDPEHLKVFVDTIHNTPRS